MGCYRRGMYALNFHVEWVKNFSNTSHAFIIILFQKETVSDW